MEQEPNLYLVVNLEAVVRRDAEGVAKVGGPDLAGVGGHHHFTGLDRDHLKIDLNL